MSSDLFYMSIEWMQITMCLPPESEFYSKFNNSVFLYELWENDERIFGLKTNDGELWEIRNSMRKKLKKRTRPLGICKSYPCPPSWLQNKYGE